MLDADQVTLTKLESSGSGLFIFDILSLYLVYVNNLNRSTEDD